jgi:hypothetical protein
MVENICMYLLSTGKHVFKKVGVLAERERKRERKKPRLSERGFNEVHFIPGGRGGRGGRSGAVKKRISSEIDIS